MVRGANQAGRKGCASNPAELDSVGKDSAVPLINPAELDSAGADSAVATHGAPFGFMSQSKVRTLLDEIMQGLNTSSARFPVNFVEEDADEGINSLRQETRIRAAMDSGSCRNVTHPKTLPAGTKVTPNTSGKHFSGAGGEVIEKFGECVSQISKEHMAKWAADGPSLM